MGPEALPQALQNSPEQGFGSTCLPYHSHRHGSCRLARPLLPPASWPGPLLCMNTPAFSGRRHTLLEGASLPAALHHPACPCLQGEGQQVHPGGAQAYEDPGRQAHRPPSSGRGQGGSCLQHALLLVGAALHASDCAGPQPCCACCAPAGMSRRRPHWVLQTLRRHCIVAPLFRSVSAAVQGLLKCLLWLQKLAQHMLGQPILCVSLHLACAASYPAAASASGSVPWLQKLEKLRSELHFIGTAARNTHTVFVDDDGQAQAFSPGESCGCCLSKIHACWLACTTC